MSQINNRILDHDDLVKSVDLFKQLNVTQTAKIVEQTDSINGMRKTLKAKYDMIR